MVHCRVAVLVAFLLCCGVLADFNQYGYCSTGSTTPLKGNNGVFGCNGYSAGTMSFNLTTTKAIFVSFNSFSLSYSTTLQVNSPSGSYTFSTNAPASSMTLPAGLTTFVLTSSYSWNAPYGFEVIITDNFYSLQPGQPMTLQAVQPGGFVYFVLPSLSYGAYLNIQLAVNSYDGFMSPALFAQLNTLPTLSSYAYYNTSSGSSSHPKVSIGIKNPQNAVYVIGVFLYGSSSSLTISALWNFTFNFLSNGQVVNTDTVKNQFYQIQVPMQTPQLTLRISRQLPGGYVVGYVGAGYLPSTTQYNYKLDTTQQSYIQLQIKKPYNATSATPGLYVFNFVSAYGGDAGYIFEASWGNNQTDALTLEQFESKSKRQATIIYDNADN